MRRVAGIALTSVSALLAASCGTLGQAGTDAESYPTGPVHVVVPYAAGGPTDLAGRASADCLSEKLGEDVVVENKPGGAGSIGMTEAITAKPDGHTLAVGTIGNLVVAPRIAEGVQYSREDFTPIGTIYELPSVFLTGGDAGYGSAEDLFDEAEGAPGSISVATPGASTLYHVELQRLADLYGIELQLVPYDGTSEAMGALLGGNADAAFVDASENIVEQVDSGELRALATGAAEELPYLEGVPTLVELGYPELTNTTSFFSLVAPAETPEGVVEALAANLAECTADDSVRERLGQRYVPEEFVGSGEVESALDDADAVYGEVLAEDE